MIQSMQRRPGAAPGNLPIRRRLQGRINAVSMGLLENEGVGSIVSKDAIGLNKEIDAGKVGKIFGVEARQGPFLFDIRHQLSKPGKPKAALIFGKR